MDESNLETILKEIEEMQCIKERTADLYVDTPIKKPFKFAIAQHLVNVYSLQSGLCAKQSEPEFIWIEILYRKRLNRSHDERTITSCLKDGLIKIITSFDKVLKVEQHNEYNRKLIKLTVVTPEKMKSCISAMEEDNNKWYQQIAEHENEIKAAKYKIIKAERNLSLVLYKHPYEDEL